MIFLEKCLATVAILAVGCAHSNDIGNLPTVAAFHLSCSNLSYTTFSRQQGIPNIVGVTGCDKKAVFKRRLHQRFGFRTTRNAPWVQER